MTVKESKIKQHKQKTLISASLVKIMQGILQIPVANRKAILIRHQIFRHHESVKPVKQRKAIIYLIKQLAVTFLSHLLKILQQTFSMHTQRKNRCIESLA